MRTAVVLGAGGYVGQAFHVGVLNALSEASGFDPRTADILVGTSAGSLVAAGLAGGLSVADMRAELTGEALSPEGKRLRTRAPAGPSGLGAGAGAGVEGWPDPPVRRRPLAPMALAAAARRPWAVRPAAVVSGVLPAGRMPTESISRTVSGLHPDGWPERDLRICAVRARDARRVVFGCAGAPATDVATAVAASCAIPAYFRPVYVDGAAYVDGGVHSPTNADVVTGDAPDLVLVLSPMSMRRAGRRPPVDVAMRLAVRSYLAVEVRALRRAGSRVVVLQPGAGDLAVMGANPMRGSGVEQVITTVAASVHARLAAQPDLVALLSGATGQ